MRHLNTLCLALLLCLGCAGCGNKYYSAPLEGEVPLAYGPSKGTLYVRSEVGAGRIWLPTALATLNYEITEREGGLLWRVEARGRYLGLKDGKAVRPDSLDGVFKLYPLTESHEPLFFTVRTDRRGNVETMGDPTSIAKGTPLPQPFWKQYYRSLFSSVFIPFSADKARMDAVVSHAQSCLLPQDSLHFPASDIVLAGKQEAFGDTGLVLHYENQSREYKNSNRQKCTDSVEVDMVIDAQTCIPVNGRAIYTGVNGRRYIFISREEK